MTKTLLYKGSLYASLEELKETKVMPAMPMNDMISDDYLKQIDKLNKRLKNFGWGIYPTEMTKHHHGRKVIVVRFDPKHFDRMKHTYDNLLEALDALSTRIKDQRFHELVLPQFTRTSRIQRG